MYRSRRADEDAEAGGAAARGAASAAPADEFADEFDEDDDDEMGGFLVHDGPGGDREHRENRRRLAKSARARGISTEALQDILDVFGPDNDVNERLAAWYEQKEGAAEEADGEADVRAVSLWCLPSVPASRLSRLI
jgi:hypothetical protein